MSFIFSFVLTPSLNLDIGGNRKNCPNWHTKDNNKNKKSSSIKFDIIFVNIQWNLSFMMIFRHDELLNNYVSYFILFFSWHLFLFVMIDLTNFFFHHFELVNNLLVFLWRLLGDTLLFFFFFQFKNFLKLWVFTNMVIVTMCNNFAFLKDNNAICSV